jgi:uncharacterized repeat protein (TIGR01451 family)
VVPSRESKIYSTRITDPDKNLLKDMYGVTVGGFPLGSGNPGDDNAQFGVNIELVEAADDGSWGRIKIYNQSVDFKTTVDKAEVSGLPGDVYTLTYQTVVENQGSEVDSNVYLTYTLDSDLTAVSLTEDNEHGTVKFPPTTAWWTDGLAVDETVTLTLVATGTVSMMDTVSTQVSAYDGQVERELGAVETDIATYSIYLPLVTKNYEAGS